MLRAYRMVLRLSDGNSNAHNRRSNNETHRERERAQNRSEMSKKEHTLHLKKSYGSAHTLYDANNNNNRWHQQQWHTKLYKQTTLFLFLSLTLFAFLPKYTMNSYSNPTIWIAIEIVCGNETASTINIERRSDKEGKRERARATHTVRKYAVCARFIVCEPSEWMNEEKKNTHNKFMELILMQLSCCNISLLSSVAG